MIIVNGIAVLAYLAVTWYVLRTAREYAVIFGYFSFMLTWALISCFYNDTGIFNLELWRFTTGTLATTRLAILYICFNLGFLVLACCLRHHPLPRIDYVCSRRPLRLGHFKAAAYAAIGLIVAYIAYSFATTGIPFLSGVNRLEYFKDAGVVERHLIIYGPMIAFALGFYARKRRRRSVNGVIMALFMLFVFMIGHKFSLPIILAVSYFTPVSMRYIAAHRKKRLFTMKRLAILGTVVSLLVLITFGAYMYALGDASHSYNLLVNRIFAFQGQMWWAVDYDISREGRYDPDHWRAELTGVLNPEGIRDGEVGMKYLMVKVLGPEKAFTIFNRGYLYTHTYPAILIATFPYWFAAVIQFTAGMIFFGLLYYLYHSILYRHFIRAVIAMVIFMPFLATLFSGNIAVVLTPALFLKVLILAVLEAPAYFSRAYHRRGVSSGYAHAERLIPGRAGGYAPQ